MGGAIKSDLERMFHYRHELTKQDLERFSGRIKPMNVLIAGGSGLVGTSLIAFLQNFGCTVKNLTRNPKAPYDVKWNPDTKEIPNDILDGIDAVINLAGQNVASGRWSADIKKKIMTSRVNATSLLAETIAASDNPPKVFINASGSTFYPIDTHELYDESGPKGSAYLADVVEQWEKAAAPAEEKGVRTVKLRIAMVLTPKGGALKQMLPPFLMGAGGRIASGNQYMSWISIHDLVDIIGEALIDEKYEGVINTASPNPVTNKEFTKTFASVIKRPAIFPVPGFVIKMIFGEMGTETALASNNIKPQKLLDLNYKFRHPELKTALSFVLGKN